MGLEGTMSLIRLQENSELGTWRVIRLWSAGDPRFYTIEYAPGLKQGMTGTEKEARDYANFLRYQEKCANGWENRD